MSKKNKPLKRTMIGGQALMEGVMMRGKSAMAMAVRSPDGRVLLETKRLKPPGWYNKVPIIRGVVAFILSMISGVTTLLKSAEVSTPDEDTPSKGWMAFAVILGVVFAVGLFILLPSFLNSLILDKLVGVNQRFGQSIGVLLSSLFEGLLRIIIFVVYLLLVSKMKDIRRTFMYHGAEHRTINCYEKGLPLTVENVQSCSTRHNRCGTTFLFFVMILSILVFSFCNWLMLGLGWGTNMFIKMGVRLALLPIVAGLSYELLRGLALLPDNAFVNCLRAPGLALQRLTTYPPDDDMAEIALKSFNAVLEMDENVNIKEIKFGEFPMDNCKKFAQLSLMALGEATQEAEAETDWILCEVLNMRRNEIRNVANLNLGQYKRLEEILELRGTGKPLDYITGYSEFFGHKVKVNENVLLPRMETEILCEQAIKYIGDANLHVLDLCTGSGCISVALLKATNATVTASDVSELALSVATENVKGLNATVVKSDMFANLTGRFDLIVSNPPYIAESERFNLAKEVLCQPQMALFGGTDGLDFYRIIADNATNFLSDSGAVMLEIGHAQADDVCALFKASFKDKIADISVIKDLDSNNRVVKICLK